jgi:hypothetical protein
MESHPGIVFRDGPAGRRPGLAGGPDVWEVARVLREFDMDGDGTLQQVAKLTGLVPEQVRIALRYYADHRDEIDEWIRHVDAEAHQAEATWRRTRTFHRS